MIFCQYVIFWRDRTVKLPGTAVQDILHQPSRTIHYINIFPVIAKGHGVTRLFHCQPSPATLELPNQAAAIPGTGNVSTVMNLLLFVRAVSESHTPPLIYISVRHRAQVQHVSL